MEQFTHDPVCTCSFGNSKSLRFISDLPAVGSKEGSICVIIGPLELGREIVQRQRMMVVVNSILEWQSMKTFGRIIVVGYAAP